MRNSVIIIHNFKNPNKLTSQVFPSVNLVEDFVPGDFIRSAVLVTYSFWTKKRFHPGVL